MRVIFQWKSQFNLHSYFLSARRESLALMSCKFTSIRKDLTLKIVNSCPRALLCLWVNKQLSNQHFSSPINQPLLSVGSLPWGSAHTAACGKHNVQQHIKTSFQTWWIDYMWFVPTAMTVCTQRDLSHTERPCCTPFIYFLQRHHFLFLMCGGCWGKRVTPLQSFSLSTFTIHLIYMIRIIDVVTT